MLGATVTVSATASHQSGTISSVAFQANSSLIGTATITPYSVAWSNMPGGVYSVTAVARDTQGLTVTSSPITVKISKALKSVRTNRKNASSIESSFTSSATSSPNTAVQSSSEIDSLVAALEQTYIDFYDERTMFAPAEQIDEYLFAALFLARSSASLAKRPSLNDAVADRMSKVDAYLSFCEDLMVSGVISQATLAAAKQVNAQANLTISRPDSLPMIGAGFLLSPNGPARMSVAASTPFTTQTMNAPSGGQSYELGGVSVTIKGQAAQVLSIAPTSVTFTVPGDLLGGLADILVTSREGYMSFATASVSGLNPTILIQSGSPSGTGVILDALGVRSGVFSTTTPAQFLGLDTRTRLSILASGISTGLANTDFSNDIWLANGQLLANLAEFVVVEARTSAGTVVRLPVEFAGMQGVLPGLDQVNVILTPELARAGSVQLTVVVGSSRSNPVTIAMQ